MTFGAILKNVIFQFRTSVDSFWATIGKLGLLLISASGHTGQENLPTGKNSEKWKCIRSTSTERGKISSFLSD